VIYVVVIVVLALLIVTAPVTGLDYQIRRILRFQRRRFAKRPIPTLAIFRRAKQPVSMITVRDFVVNLQLGTAMEATLSRALSQSAKQFANRGLFGQRLNRHVESRLSISPEAVLEGLVSDFDSTHLVDLLERVRMAADGGVSYNRIFTLTVDEIQEDIRSRLEQSIQRTPTRLAVVMTAGFFMPILVLLLVPLVAYLRW
jgi:hypothetical protein